MAPTDPGAILTAEARKVVTVLFADLVGSTALTERLDPEEAREVVGRFYATVQAAVEPFGGAVANLLGDAVLVVFGLPIAHEDDPERAVRAGLALRDAMPLLNERLDPDHGVRLAVRVGICTGEVVAASGSTFDRDFLISDAVTTAARIQQNVGPGSVVVGERTYRLTREVIEYRGLPPLEVKGKESRLAVWEALAPQASRPEERRVAAPLVGRRGELSLLRQLYERSRDERIAHLATVVGQPGIGKSRLVREFLAEVQQTGPAPHILRGRGIALGGQIGYHALLDILRGQGGLLDTDTPETVREKLGRWLRENLPESEGLLEGLLLTFGTDGGVSPEQTRQALFDTWSALLASLSARAPVVAVFEDLHWADDGVLDLIQSVPARVQEAALFLVCLGRPELLERRPAWAGGGRNTATIELRPLRLADAEQLVAALDQGRLAPEVLHAVAQRAEGNPLFAEELVRMLAESAADAGATIPDTVQAVIAARIDRLPADERRVLQGAAVIGRKFWASAVAELARLPAEDAALAIAGLAAKDLVTRRPQSAVAGEPEYAFRQILTRDVAYGMLPRSQRQRAHALAGRWLEARLGERAEEAVEILAEHFRLAGDDAAAAAYLRRAANKARRLYANADALRLFDQALHASRRAGLAQEIPHLHLDRGEVHQLLGAYPAAMADFETGLAAARQGADRALEALLENRIGLIHHREARLEEAEARFERAAALAREAGDGRTLGQSLVDLANIAWDRGDMEAADGILSEGVALVRESGDLSSLARALNLRCMVHLAMGDGGGAVAAAEEALAAAREAGDKSREATSLSYLGVVSAWMGRPRTAIDYEVAAVSLAEAIGDRRRAAYAKEFLAQAYHDMGEWGEAIRLTLEFLPMAHQVTPLELPFIYLFLGQMYDGIGDPERAREAFRAASATEARSLGWQMVVLLAEIRLARLEGDAEALNRTLDRIGQADWEAFAPSGGMALLPVGEALIETGRLDELRSILARMRPVMQEMDAAPYLAALAIVESRLAARDGDTDAAAGLLDRAVRWGEAADNAFMVRRALELRLDLFNRPEDREALARLHARIAASLPEDLREVFLASQRAGLVR